MDHEARIMEQNKWSIEHNASSPRSRDFSFESFFCSMIRVPWSILRARRGVSLIELLVSIAIVAVLAGLGMINLFGRRGQVELEGTAQQMSILLKEARSRSISQSSSTSWGVHFENATGTAPFYALFAGSYGTSTRVNYNRLPPSVGYVSSSIPAGSSVNVIFDQMTGLSATSTNLRIYMIANPVNSSTIAISQSGLVDWVLGTPSSTAPSVLTLAASGISTSTAVLNGSVNPNGLLTAAWFEWGTSGSFGSSTASSSLGSGSTAVPTSANLSGLTPGTTYYFRVDAQSSAGTSYGSTLTFAALSGTGVISSGTGEHYAWSDNFGWLDFYDPGNITVNSSQLTGYASSTGGYGYVLLDCATAPSGNICGTSNFKVSNTSGGVLSGYAWNDTIGWISMNCSDPGICAASNYSVTIDASGNFSGWAWNENVGWISFNCSNTSSCATSNYKVKTTWTH